MVITCDRCNIKFITNKINDLKNENLKTQFEYSNLKYKLYEQYSTMNRLEEFRYFTQKYNHNNIEIINSEVSKVFGKLIVAETNSIILCIEKDFELSKSQFINNIEEYSKAKPLHEGTFEYTHKGKQLSISYKVVNI